jgi:hypothetical protein
LPKGAEATCEIDDFIGEARSHSIRPAVGCGLGRQRCLLAKLTAAAGSNSFCEEEPQDVYFSLDIVPHRFGQWLVRIALNLVLSGMDQGYAHSILIQLAAQISMHHDNADAPDRTGPRQQESYAGKWVMA